MQLSKYFYTAFYALMISFALYCAHFFSEQNKKPIIYISKQQSSFNLEENFWRFFHLGEKRMASSLLWIATILESDQEHYKKKDLNSWMFLRFNTISILDPLFYENYSFGGIYLSIIKDDLPGASILYDKGLSFYPDDYTLLKDAGFHYYFEVGDFEKALPLYKKLQTHPKNSPVALSILARLLASHGDLPTAYWALESKYEQLKNKDSFIAKKIREHLYAIKAEIDLKCLNQKNTNLCAKKDLDGSFYFLTSEGKYQASKKWTPFRIKTKKAE